MVLIADISVILCQIHVRLYFISYATGTEKLRITTLSPAAIFVKAPTWIASLSRCMTLAML